ncbi:CE1759 family FMN reductase [Lysinibacter sp. HNR]|uniref:CE1759 family FMN reductase n=1 Tax=Lysinibacter sp. HNR TaxID=3031408 RepID=UPI002435F833|nr:CE1759 family FMN reductase [Lysinibacter sp. HNR]WGD37311.1 NAD(P)H-dependent oxidoreductase [Lysinibacter sp. HNR]
MTGTDQKQFRVVVVNAGVSDPSSTQLLADRLSLRVEAAAQQNGHTVETLHIGLRELLPELPGALASGYLGTKFTAAVEMLASADGVIATTPVYKAGLSGLFSSFFQVLDNDLLIAKPVLLGATAGTTRHALVVDEQMRSMFAFLRAMTAPTSVFAAGEDWQDTALSKRIDRAAQELTVLMESDVERRIRDTSWDSYKHELGSAASIAAGAKNDIDLDSDLMRLATGGTFGTPKA